MTKALIAVGILAVGFGGCGSPPPGGTAAGRSLGAVGGAGGGTGSAAPGGAANAGAGGSENFKISNGQDAGGDCSNHAPGCGCNSVGSTVSCANGGTQTCQGHGEFGTWGPCVCTPTTCAALGDTCGSAPDGCGGTLHCGTCESPDICGGAGVANRCGCTPKTCASLDAQCGDIPDGCGGTLHCGSCSAPQSCGGGGTPYHCGGCTTLCRPGQSVWCPGPGYCYQGDLWDHQAIETCQPNGKFGPCVEGGSASTNCGDGRSVGEGWVGSCSAALCK